MSKISKSDITFLVEKMCEQSLILFREELNIISEGLDCGKTIKLSPELKEFVLNLRRCFGKDDTIRKALNFILWMDLSQDSKTGKLIKPKEEVPVDKEKYPF